MLRTVAGRLSGIGRLGLLPAAFNPPTMAHLALADEAQAAFGLRQVAFVLPESLPHKRIERPSVQERLQWLAALVANRPDRAAVSCRAGLVVEIVRAFREVVEPACELCVISGRDAAERYAAWDYGEGETFAEQLERYRLLVAARDGNYRVAPEFAGRIFPFRIEARHSQAASSTVRAAIRANRPWRHMVPAAIRDSVGQAYQGVCG